MLVRPKMFIVPATRLFLAGALFLARPGLAGNPLWNGAGSVTNNYFSNTNNWFVGNAPPGNSINNLPVGFGPLAGGATNTASCDASGNSQTWTFNVGTAPMIVTLNNQQLGAATGPDVFVNNSTNLQTVNGVFRVFDIGGTTTSRRFNAAAGPLAIIASQIQIRGDSAPSVWALEFGGASGGTFNSAFNNVNFTGTLNYFKSGIGTWEIISALPNLTANASALTVLGGTLTLDAANTFSGATAVGSGAVLNLTTLSAGAGAFTISNSATLGVLLADSSSSLTNSSLNLGTTGTDNTAVNFDFGNVASPALPPLTVTGALTVNGTGTVNITNGLLAVGQFPLIKYGSLSGGLVLGTLPAGVNALLSNNVARSSLDLVIYSSLDAADVISWNGNVSAVWDTNATANWKNGLFTGLFYTDTNEVVLDDSAAGNFAITLNSTVKPGSLTVSATNNYSISGSGAIAGSTILAKSGSGVLTLNNANSFVGQTTVNAGALVLNNLNSIAAGGSLNIASGAVAQPKLAGTYAAMPIIINGASAANGSFGGALDFHSGGTTTVTWPGPINLNAANATLGGYGVTYSVTLSGQLTGSGGLTFRPEGGSAASHTATLVISNPTNNYSGSTTMQVGTAELSSTLKLGVNNGLPAGTPLNLNRVGSSGVVYFDLAGYTQTVAALTANFTSNAVINSSGTVGALIISNTTASAFTGDLGVAGKANFSFTKLGAGSLAIGGPNVFTGSTIIGGGTLVVTNLITATSGLILSNNAALQLAVGGVSGATNIWVNGNVTLAGQLNLTDAGIVSNTPYPVIYYSGTLNTNGLTIAPFPPWAFTVDTSVSHLVRLVPTQQFPLVQFANVNFSVTTLTTNLGGVLRGVPLGPIWYEVRDQTNRLWDFGAAPANSPWSITVRHLRAGTNTVTMFAQNGAGVIQSNSVQLTLTLGPNTGVRPRPIPAEIWWGGISDNTGLTNYSQWPFVQKFQDGYFFHSAYWGGSTAWLQQSLAQNLLPFNAKYWPELGGFITNPSTNSAASQLSTWGNWAANCEANGIIWSEFTHDYHMENMQQLCQVNPTWPTNDDIAWWTGDLSIADGTYPYTNGTWSDIFKGYYARFPHVKVGQTSQPEWWPWGNFPAGVANSSLAFTITNSSGQNINFSLNASNIFASFVNMASAIGYPYFSLQSDAPWDYFGGGGVGTAASEATMRQMIRAYEIYFQSRGGRHSLICNVSNAGTNNQGSVTAANNYYEASSLSSMYRHQQEGGRANRYLYESWYWGIPYAVVPETQPGSYTHLALSAIKYLKGIMDTNGTLENLTLTLLSTNGGTNTITLTNRGDVMCLPAIAAFETGSGAGTVTYYDALGSNITSAILSPEGWVYTNQLPAGQSTAIRVVPSVLPLNRAVTLEAFWNPQDPTGVVRDRLVLTPPKTPPSLNAISNRTLIAGQTLTVTNTATDTNVPAQTLAFNLLTSPAGMILNPTNGLLTWRPTVSQSPTTNPVAVVVADNGVPQLSATQAFTVFVLRPATPALTLPALTNGVFNLRVTGDSGPDYILLGTTNLNPPVTWQPLITNVSAVPPFTFTDPATNASSKFYRVQIAP